MSGALRSANDKLQTLKSRRIQEGKRRKKTKRYR